MHDIAGTITHYLLTLANRNDPISVAMSKVAKASTIVAARCHCHWRYHLKYNANVNYPLRGLYTAEKTLRVVTVASDGDLKSWEDFY